MLQPSFECRAFPMAAAKSQSQKLTLLPPIPQTLFLLQSRSAPKSVSVYGSPILLVMGAPQSFIAGRILCEDARLLFPGFVHDILWNHALCTIKEEVERKYDYTP